MLKFIKNFEITKCPVEGRNLLVMSMLLIFVSPKAGSASLIFSLIIIFINKEALKKYGIFLDNGLISELIIEERTKKSFDAHPVKITKIEEDFKNKNAEDQLSDIKTKYLRKNIRLVFKDEQLVINKILELQKKKFSFIQINKYLTNKINKVTSSATRSADDSEFLVVLVDV